MYVLRTAFLKVRIWYFLSFLIRTSLDKLRECSEFFPVFGIFQFSTAVIWRETDEMNILKKIKRFKKNGASAEDVAKQGQSAENKVSNE